MDLGTGVYPLRLQPKRTVETLPGRTVQTFRIYHITGITGRNNTTGAAYRPAIHHKGKRGAGEGTLKGTGKRVQLNHYFPASMMLIFSMI
jgi:hypothetical protein